MNVEATIETLDKYYRKVAYKEAQYPDVSKVAVARTKKILSRNRSELEALNLEPPYICISAEGGLLVYWGSERRGIKKSVSIRIGSFGRECKLKYTCNGDVLAEIVNPASISLGNYLRMLL